MAAPTETPTKGTADSGAESPTTARPLEMDDDDVQESSILAVDNTETGTPKDSSHTTAAAPTTETTPAPKPTSAETAQPEAPPAKPPRPPTEAQKNAMILKEAFPGVDDGVIKAVLSASGGNVERAFHALLEMTDPDAVTNEPEAAADPAPPPQPPRPQGRPQMSQLEADELYARQLAEHYDNVGAYESRTSNRSRDGRSRHTQDSEEREYNFIEDELPLIRDNLRQGFLETQTKVNGWIGALRKRIEDSFDESDEPHGQQGRRPGEPSSRRSGDYDADPQVLGDDFAGMRLSADGTPIRRSQTGSYRQSTDSARQNDGRKVGFRDEQDEIDMFERSPQVPPKDSPAATKASKWQPLSTVDPQPIGDNDPFSLGDSEDERDNNKDSTSKDGKPKDATAAEDDEGERLRKATAEAMADSLDEPSGKPTSKTSA